MDTYPLVKLKAIQPYFAELLDADQFEAPKKPVFEVDLTLKGQDAVAAMVKRNK